MNLDNSIGRDSVTDRTSSGDRQCSAGENGSNFAEELAEDFIHSLSSIGSAGTICNEESDAEMEPPNLEKLRRNSVSTSNLPNIHSGSHRSIYTSIVLMPENDAKWTQLAKRDAVSKFCVIPVLEDQIGTKMLANNDLEQVGDESNESSLESNNPIRALLARRALTLPHSELSPIAEMPFGSAVDINQSLRDIRKAKSHGQVLPSKENLRNNFLFQCLSFFFVYMSYVPIRGLQTSLNHQNDLGSISVSAIFASCIVGSLMCPVLVQRFGAKRTLCMCTLGFLVYNVGNVYASFYTLIPSSMIVGLSMSTLLGAQGAYQTNVAAAYSTVTQTKIGKVLPFFSGIYFTFLQTANIVGNALGSTVLKVLGPIIDKEFYADIMEFNQTNSSSNCGADFCNVFSDGGKARVSPKALYTLLGILFVMILLSVGICAFFVDRLDSIFKGRDKTVWSHMKTVFSYHKDYQSWLLLPLAMYCSFGPSLVFGDLVRAFVTCPIGLDMIGYAMVCYAAASAVMASTSGFITRLIGNVALPYFGFAGSISLYTIMLMWKPDKDDSYLIFLLFSCVGICHAIYQTKYHSLIGVLFAGRSETAFSFFLTYQSICSSMVFALSSLVCVRIKLFSGAAFIGVTSIAYTILCYRIKIEKKDEKIINI